MKRTICAALLLSGCFSDTQDPVGSDADGTTAAETGGTTGDTTGDTTGGTTGDISSTETSQGTETTGETSGATGDTTSDTTGATDGTTSEGSTGGVENPYLPCPSGTCEDGSFCSTYDGHHVCKPPCNPGACPPIPGWDVACEASLCVVLCDAMTPCPDSMICTAFAAGEGTCFHP